MNKVELDEFLRNLFMRLMRKPTVKMWQPCRWKVRNYHLFFEVKGLLFTGTVEIAINGKEDGYNIYFLGRLNTIEKFIPNVDGKNLVQVLDANIENPMDGTYFNLVKRYAKQNNRSRQRRGVLI